MDNIKPLVSVVMPVFNAELYIDEAINSILTQTFEAFELIIINDGSTDSSLKIIKQWQQKDCRIRVFNQENKGRSRARNKGVELAVTKYIAMMDPDDISIPERLDLSYKYLQNHHDVVGVSGRYEVMCMYGVTLHVPDSPLKHQDIEYHLLRDSGNAFLQPACMLRKSVIKEVGGYDSMFELGEDSDLFLRMALKGQLANLPDMLLRYRKHPQSITNIADQRFVENCMLRLNKAWKDRGLELGDDFNHVLKNIKRKKAHESLLKWGWNALAKGKVLIARQYARKLIISQPFNIDVYRFVYCAIRGR